MADGTVTMFVALCRCACAWLVIVLTAVTSNDANLQLVYNVQEETPPGTLFGNIVTDAHLATKYNQKTIRKLRFQFLTKPKLDKQYFAIEHTTGMLKTTDRIDRDELCPQKDECVVKFDIAIQPTSFFQIIKIQVFIEDSNDNHPVFPQRRITHRISESATVGTSFVIPPARDPDSAMNGIQEYELVQMGDLYSLKVRKTADGATDLRLVLNVKLDRENFDHDEVSIIAYDGGIPRAKSGSIIVAIDVVDSNDNDPKFDNNTYDVHVMENIPTGKTVLRVRARDADSGDNGRIVYQFSKHTQQEHGHLFGITEDTGEVFVRGNLDYEQSFIYYLSLIAHDKGPDSLPAHATAVIHIEDQNDNAPEISVNTLTMNSEAQVMENSDLETFVAHISAIDQDVGDNGKFTCSIDNPNFKLNKMYLKEYKIVTSTVFDREERDAYEIELVCKDRGLQPQVSIVDIIVHVLDDNDHRPVFSKEAYSEVIQENNPMGMYILQVNATDRDIGRNGKVTYRLQGKASDMLHIDPDTGVITADIIFDYEESREMIFDVIAEDGGEPQNSASIPVHLTVIDLNDERPIFDKESYMFGIFENENEGTSVGEVHAYDKDSPPLDKFFYYLDPNSVSASLFQIDSTSGEITTTRLLDRERQAVHYLVATATPADDPTYTSSASVTVHVADRNDNAPQFEFPSIRNHSLEVSGLAPMAYVISRLQAHDDDKSTNAKMTFMIKDGNRGNAFVIDPITGTIAINTDLTKFNEDKTVFELKLEVHDGGKPQKSDSGELIIIVNKNLPFALRSQTTFLSGENLTIVLAFALATVFVAIIIIIAIVVIIRRSKHNGQEAGSPAKEKAAMLGPVEATVGAVVEDGGGGGGVHAGTLGRCGGGNGTLGRTAPNHYVSADEVGMMRNGQVTLLPSQQHHYSYCDTDFQQLNKEPTCASYVGPLSHNTLGWTATAGVKTTIPAHQH